MECIEARPLIPSYLDGELSEAQARPLRKHLLDCQECRAGAQGEKHLKRWFVPEEPVAVPRDFAARVARRAFAGDDGERYGAAASVAAFDRPRDVSLKFILQVTSIAAVLLIFLSIAIGNLSLPSGDKLRADDNPEITLDQAIMELETLDRAETGADGAAGAISRARANAADPAPVSAKRPKPPQPAAPIHGGEGARR